MMDVCKQSGIDTQVLGDPLSVSFIEPVRGRCERGRRLICETLIGVVETIKARAGRFCVVCRRSLWN